MLIVFAALIIGGRGLSVYILVLPVIMLVQFLFVLGIVLVVSGLTVYFRDLEHILNIVMMAWFYLTPIVYPPQMVPQELSFVLALNPMAGVIECYRNILFYRCMPDFSTLLFAFLTGLAAVVLGGAIFQRLQRGFAEEL